MTASLQGKTTPAMLWETSHRFLTGSIEEATQVGGDMKDILMTMGSLVRWVEEVVKVREDDKTMWFGGPAWIDFTDLWIGLARKVCRGKE
jgi:hypothetical protein